MELRKPTEDELRLVRHLISLVTREKVEADALDQMSVAPMDDGGMGSLFITNGDDSSIRSFGRQLSECRFADSDGVEVLASLNVDSQGDLFELDIWKTDFSRLVRIPSHFPNAER